MLGEIFFFFLDDCSIYIGVGFWDMLKKESKGKLCFIKGLYFFGKLFVILGYIFLGDNLFFWCLVVRFLKFLLGVLFFF